MTSKTSSRSSLASRRPKLMRAAATCPQLATSNASRQDLATLQEYGATTILERVASAQPTSSVCSSPGQRSPLNLSLARKELDGGVLQSGNYFSFPSFEEFEESERIDGRSDKGVP